VTFQRFSRGTFQSFILHIANKISEEVPLRAAISAPGPCLLTRLIPRTVRDMLGGLKVDVVMLSGSDVISDDVSVGITRMNPTFSNES
jgi:hypothetical protein